MIEILTTQEFQPDMLRCNTMVSYLLIMAAGILLCYIGLILICELFYLVFCKIVDEKFDYRVVLRILTDLKIEDEI